MKTWYDDLIRRLDKKTWYKDLIWKLDTKSWWKNFNIKTWHENLIWRLQTNSLMCFVKFVFPLFLSLHDWLHFEAEKNRIQISKRKSKSISCTLNNYNIFITTWIHIYCIISILLKTFHLDRRSLLLLFSIVKITSAHATPRNEMSKKKVCK